MVYMHKASVQKLHCYLKSERILSSKLDCVPLLNQNQIRQ